MKNNKLIDNRGFVIVETIIVAVFIIGICTFLFGNFIPLIGDYERINMYDDLSSKYKTHEIRKMILREIDNNSNNKKIFTDYISDSSKYHIYSSYETKSGNNTIVKHQLCDKLVTGSNKNYCNKLLGGRTITPEETPQPMIDVKEIVVLPFKLTDVKSEIKNDNSASRTLKEYIDYLPSYGKYDNKYDNYYRIIVVFNDGHIANIEVNYEEL